MPRRSQLAFRIHLHPFENGEEMVDDFERREVVAIPGTLEDAGVLREEPRHFGFIARAAAKLDFVLPIGFGGLDGDEVLAREIGEAGQIQSANGGTEVTGSGELQDRKSTRL